jgi:3D (Asp-Asp-Asp) domain-containing protein
MMIADSYWRKGMVTAVAVSGFVCFCEVTALDSQYAAPPDMQRDSTAPAPGPRLAFTATAYCKGLTTSAGVAARSGVAASDPMLLPIGSVIEIETADARYSGVYTVMDTGPAVQGRHVDLYMWSCNEALQFGRRPVRLTVMRLGWNPRATTPNFMERLFNGRRSSSPSRPLPQAAQPPAS